MTNSDSLKIQHAILSRKIEVHFAFVRIRSKSRYRSPESTSAFSFLASSPSICFMDKIICVNSLLSNWYTHFSWQRQQMFENTLKSGQIWNRRPRIYRILLTRHKWKWRVRCAVWDILHGRRKILLDIICLKSVTHWLKLRKVIFLRLTFMVTQ